MHAFNDSHQLIRPPAVPPDLAVGSGEGADPSHPYHGVDEVLGEVVGILAVLLHQAVGGAAVEEDLVGVEQALLVDEVLVVCVVEEVRRLGVERGQVVVADTALAGAAPLPLGGE